MSRPVRPESIAIGLTPLKGGAASIVAVAGMKHAGRITVAGFLATFALSKLGGWQPMRP
jgi:hypothetical protein